jgi:hypothetical protein
MKAHHILNSASNLLGASLVIVTALHISKFAAETYADEIAFAAAVLLLASCFSSYQSIRRADERIEVIADRLFVAAQALLLLAILSFWF